MRLTIKTKQAALLVGALALPLAVSCERKDREQEVNGVGEDVGNLGDNERTGAGETMPAPGATDETADLAGGQQVDLVVTEDTDFADNMAEHVGKTVQITGEVNKVVGQNAFTVDTDGAVGGDEAFVINTSGQSMAIDEGTRVTVIGPVQNLESVGKWESDFNVDLDDELFKDYEGNAVVAATRISQIEEEQPVAE